MPKERGLPGKLAQVAPVQVPADDRVLKPGRLLHDLNMLQHLPGNRVLVPQLHPVLKEGSGAGVCLPQHKLTLPLEHLILNEVVVVVDVAQPTMRSDEDDHRASMLAQAQARGQTN